MSLRTRALQQLQKRPNWVSKFCHIHHIHLIWHPYHLFKDLKQTLRGTHFKDDVSVQNAVTQWVKDQNADFYKEGILKLKHRWQKCIDLQGDWIENVKIVQNVSK
jgi:hypothetical protein